MTASKWKAMAQMTLGVSREAALAICMRLASVMFVSTWYVADEHWQAGEVAHALAFGYGHRTWEWTRGVRPYAYPAAIAAAFKLLGLAEADAATLLVYLPRVLQALLSVLGDLAFYRWCGRRRWALFMILTQWFWFYTATRTLANTAETALLMLALARYPWHVQRSGDNGWLCYATLACVLRPTAAIVWAPLCVNHLLTTPEKKLRLLLFTYLPIVTSIVGLSTLIDCYFFGDLVFTPWEFFKVNFLENIGSFYGTHPWYWYLAIGFPVVLGVNLVPFLFASYEAIRDKYAFKTQRVLLFVTVFVLAVYSLFPHKEFRFILPLVPITTYMAQDTIARWSRRAKTVWIYLVFSALLTGNVVPSVYFSHFHQRGPLDTMSILRDVVAEHPNNSSFLFLMPCHSTPYYSHLHANIPMRFLTCEPNFTTNDPSDNEAETFYRNPTEWFKKEYLNQQVGESQKKSKLPSHIILYDTLTPKISNILSYYELQHTVYHTQFPEGRVGSNINIYIRAKRTPSVNKSQQ